MRTEGKGFGTRADKGRNKGVKEWRVWSFGGQG